MGIRHIRVLNIDTEIPPLPVKIPDGKECLIRQIAIDYEEENGSVCGKFLYMIADIEKHLGYGKHGWQQFKDRNNTVDINNKKFSDCETILLALKGGLVETKRKQRVIPNKSFADELTHVFEDFLKRRKVFDMINLEETRIALSRVDTPKAVFKKQNVNAIDEVDAAKEANGKQMTEFLNNVHPGNEIADAFNNVIDSARQITRYSSLVREGTQLINEISELRVQIVDLIQKLKNKEAELDQNQKEISDIKVSLENNPLLKHPYEGKEKEIPDDIREKLERLEAENKALKDETKNLRDRIGEGENFKTAAMFPNKEQYFIGDNKEVNSRIGIAAREIAKAEDIKLPEKIRSGAENVNVYPVQILQRLEEDIKAHNRNRYTFILNPVLKAEYRV